MLEVQSADQGDFFVPRQRHQVQHLILSAKQRSKTDLLPTLRQTGQAEQESSTAASRRRALPYLAGRHSRLTTAMA